MTEQGYDLLSMTPGELSGLMETLGQPGYRAAQIFQALHCGVPDAGGMTALPKSLREMLKFPRPELETRQISADGTQKLLFRLSDGEAVESVLLDYGGEKTVCLSTQAGCRQGCAFCASTAGGKKRDLTAGEILGQLLYCGAEVSRAVLMGIGEPLDNFENTVAFLRLLSDPGGRNMSLRHVSLSTCGLVPEILKLSELGLPVTLSVSLHAPDDVTRSRIMPVNQKYPLPELISSCKMYFKRTGRRVSYEYLLLNGLNDSPVHARQLGRLLKGQGAHVNLIPYNTVPGKSFHPSPPDRAKAFLAELQWAGLTVTARRRLGADIDAACGQLRRPKDVSDQ